MAYTYEDFEKEAQKAGLLGQFSQADLNTAQSNPEFGMSMLTLKQNFANATTDDERNAAHQQAQELRSSYGNYTGAADGSGYISTGKLNNDIDTALDAANSYGAWSYDVAAPTYNNQYSAQQQALLNELLNREAFSYDKDNDPLWSSYKKQYLREGDRATSNALAQAAAASGGIPSSYAVTAGTQAGDYYATQLSDKLPALRAQAYDEYLNEYQRQLSNLEAVNNQEQLEYQKYLNELNQYNTDRDFSYNDYLTQYNILQNNLSNLQNQQQIEYDQNKAATEWAQYLKEYQDSLAQQELENSNYATEWEQYLKEYQDSLNQYQDQQNQQDIANALQVAQLFGYLPDNYADLLGIAAGTQTADQAYNEWYMAQQAAKAASGTSNSGSSSGSSGTATTGTASGSVWDAVDSWAATYGEDAVENYIKEHYKDLGYSTATQAQAAWANHLLEQSAAQAQRTTALQSLVPPASTSAQTLQNFQNALTGGSLYDNSAEYAALAKQAAQEGEGYNSAYFTAAMNNLSGQLAQGNGMNAVQGIDSFWNKLSMTQKQQVQDLLAKYGYSYS